VAGESQRHDKQHAPLAIGLEELVVAEELQLREDEQRGGDFLLWGLRVRMMAGTRCEVR
jgi:hypothetical protein